MFGSELTGYRLLNFGNERRVSRGNIPKLSSHANHIRCKLRYGANFSVGILLVLSPFSLFFKVKAEKAVWGGDMVISMKNGIGGPSSNFNKPR